MAGTTRKPSSKKVNRNSAVKKKNPGNGRKKQEEQRSLKNDVIVLVIAAVLIVLQLSNFDLCGGLHVVTDFFFGIFGIVQYVLPVYIIIAVAFLYVNEGSTRAIKKAIYVNLFILCLSIFAQLVRDPHAKSIGDLYQDGFDNKFGGGIIGGGLCILLIKGIGIIGTYILMFLVMGIVIMLITEISVLDIIHEIKVYFIEGRRDDFEEDTKTVSKKQDKMNRQQLRQEQSENKKRSRNSMLEHIKVLPEKENIEENESVEKLAKEDVHEITMDFEFDDIEDLPMTSLGSPVAGSEAVELVFEPEPIKKPTRNRKTPTTSDKVVLEENTVITGNEIAKTSVNSTKGDYVFPPISLLKKGAANKNNNEAAVRATAAKLQSVLASFGINVTITNYSCGPAVTRYEMQPEQGVKVSRITGLADDIMLNLAAEGIRIEAPIPGKAAIGIEIPNKENAVIMLRDLLDTDDFKRFPSDISFAVGKDISGKTMVSDIAKMPHLLIAGATGSGKSVCINTLIMSILYKAHPDDVKLIMIDPKVVELSSYNGIPHLLIPVVTDPKKAAGALNWAVIEMTNRYKLFAEYNVRNLQGYNDKVKEALASGECDEEKLKKMPLIVVIVDELADLMMVAHGEVEDSIVRLSQLARAAGIHLVIATQRPSVDVITGLIKANVPSRIAFAVSSGVDSRTIIDMVGAEKLLGKGDMLFYPTGYPKPLRVQGAFISDDEVGAVVDFLRANNKETSYSEEIKEQITNTANSSVGNSTGNDRDEYFIDAGRFIIEKDKASIGMLQRVYKIGFNRAARIMDQLAQAGVVGDEDGTKPRKVMMTMEEFEEYIEECV